MINYPYINEVLGLFEGKGLTRGYIPCMRGTYYGGTEPEKGEPVGASGVTIATGVDLGQQTKHGLISMGVSAELVEILEPYIGLKKQAALEKLKNAPFALTREQVEEIDIAVKKTYINITAKRFGLEKFVSAPKEAQAVAVSLCYQFGSPHRDASPNLGLAWEAMRLGDYKKAEEHLSDPHGWSKDHQIFIGTEQRPGRRMQEAALLRGIK